MFIIVSTIFCSRWHSSLNWLSSCSSCSLSASSRNSSVPSSKSGLQNKLFLAAQISTEAIEQIHTSSSKIPDFQFFSVWAVQVGRSRLSRNKF